MRSSRLRLKSWLSCRLRARGNHCAHLVVVVFVRSAVERRDRNFFFHFFFDVISFETRFWVQNSIMSPPRNTSWFRRNAANFPPESVLQWLGRCWHSFRISRTVGFLFFFSTECSDEFQQRSSQKRARSKMTDCQRKRQMSPGKSRAQRNGNFHKSRPPPGWRIRRNRRQPLFRNENYRICFQRP